MYNPFSSLKISLSNTIIMKARCKKCGERPNTLYSLRTAEITKDIKGYSLGSDKRKSYTKKMNSKWYLNFNPSEFVNFDMLRFSLSSIMSSYKSFPHRVNKNVPAFVSEEVLTCPCSRSVWMWTDLGWQFMPDHKNRRSHKSYPDHLLY